MELCLLTYVWEVECRRDDSHHWTDMVEELIEWSFVLAYIISNGGIGSGDDGSLGLAEVMLSHGADDI
jgi:hypothetical protein